MFLAKIQALLSSFQEATLKSPRHPIYKQRPWLVLVINHPNFPSEVPDHPEAEEYFRHWDMFARGLTFRAPESFSSFLQNRRQPKPHHWRLAIFGKALLLVRRQSWK